jgi:hypothetical protein
LLELKLRQFGVETIGWHALETLTMPLAIAFLTGCAEDVKLAGEM